MRLIFLKYKEKFLKGTLTFTRIALPFFFFLSIFCSLFPKILDKINLNINFCIGKNTYSDLVGILAGIGTVIFALIIFIAEVSSEAENTNKTYVLLERSCLLELVTYTILTFILLIFKLANYFTLLLIVSIGASAIFAVANILFLLTNRKLLYSEIKNNLGKRIKSSIDIEITQKDRENIKKQEKKLEEGNNIEKVRKKRSDEEEISLIEIEQGIEELENQYIDLIKMRHSSKLRTLRDMYESFADIGLERIDKYKKDLTKKSINKEISFTDFETTSLIVKSYFRLLDTALNLEDEESIFITSYFSIIVAKASIKYSNFSVFDEFLRIYSSLYSVILAFKDKKTKDRIIKTIISVDVKNLLLSIKDNSRCVSFFEGISFLFYDLLKISFREKKEKDFEFFLNELKQLFINFYDWMDPEQEENKDFENEMFFGLTSDIFYKIILNKNNPLKNKFYLLTLNVLLNNKNASFFEDIFEKSVKTFKKEEDKMCQEWEKEEGEDQIIINGHTNSWSCLDKFYRFYIFVLYSKYQMENNAIKNFINQNFEKKDENIKKLLIEILKLNETKEINSFEENDVFYASLFE